jgi:aminotransferase EvaB
MKIKFLDLSVQDTVERDAITNVVKWHLETGRLIEGEPLSSFETLLAATIDRSFAVGVGSGTDALILALRRAVHDGQRGLKVYTSPFSWIATSTAIKIAGLVPIFTEIGDDLMMRPDCLPAAPEGDVAGVVFPHLHGHSGRVRELRDYCDRNGLFLIEDCAQSFGAKDEFGHPVGWYGDYSCFSFNPMKSLGGLGDGGSVLFDSIEDREWFLAARHSGLVDMTAKAALLSHNCRLDSLQASILSIRLARFGHKMSFRQKIFEHYQSQLPQQISLVAPRNGTQQSYYVLQALAPDREKFMSYLSHWGIETRVRHPFLISDHPIFADSRCDFDVESARKTLGQIVCLPFHDNLSSEDVTYVCDKARDFYS